MDGYTIDDIVAMQKKAHKDGTIKRHQEKLDKMSNAEFEKYVNDTYNEDQKQKSDKAIADAIREQNKTWTKEAHTMPYMAALYEDSRDPVIKPKDEYEMKIVEVFKKPTDINNDEYNRDLVKYNWQQQWARTHEDINSAIRQGMNPNIGRSKKWVYENRYRPYKKDFGEFQNSDEYKNAIEKDFIIHAQLKEEEDQRLETIFKYLKEPTKKNTKKRHIEEVKTEEHNDEKIKAASSSIVTKTKDPKELRKDNLRDRMNKKRKQEAEEKLKKQKEHAQKLPKPTQEDLAHAIEGLPEGWGANISNSWNRIYYFKTDGTNNQQWTRPTNSGGKKKGKSVKKKSSKKGKGTRKK